MLKDSASGWRGASDAVLGIEKQPFVSDAEGDSVAVDGAVRAQRTYRDAVLT
jgi:hypothetical protein